MKRFAWIAVISLTVLLASVPAQAADIENEIDGSFRLRSYNQSNFSGTENGTGDLNQTDMRMRLRYTGTVDDDFKVVLQLEMNHIWGESDDWGQEDENDDIRIRNLYAEFNEWDIGFKLGKQDYIFNRGLLFDDLISGGVFTYDAGDFVEGLSLQLISAKIYEGALRPTYDDDFFNTDTLEDAYVSDDGEQYDVDLFGIVPSFSIGDAVKITPTYLVFRSTNAIQAIHDDNYVGVKRLSVSYLGVDVDVELDILNAWATYLTQSGSLERLGYVDGELSGSLIAAGAESEIGPFKIYGQVFQATGDDDYYDDQIKAFQVPFGQYYSWAEIMGAGVFDNQVSTGSNGAAISNITAMNVGVEMELLENFTITVDLWNASIIEDSYYATGELYAESGSALGTELDIKATYQLREGVEADLIFATLAAGDATHGGSDAPANPTEIGLQISTEF